MEELLFVEKYRPKKIDDCILSNDLKNTFKDFVKNKNVPNLLLTGKPGVGKTTVAKALMNELDLDYIIINGSMDGNIDTLRYKIRDFASSISFSGSRKYVIVDEADFLNQNSTAPAFRNFIEEYSKNCGFIFTANFEDKILDALKSRLITIRFRIEKDEKKDIMGQMYKRACKILDAENIEYDKKAVGSLIQRDFPDYRKILNSLQRYSASGKIDSGILVSFDSENFGRLVNYLKEKNFTKMREWVTENIDTDPHVIMRKFYDQAADKVEKKDIPYLVVLISKYQYQAAFAADQEINLVAFLTECMADVQFT